MGNKLIRNMFLLLLVTALFAGCGLLTQEYELTISVMPEEGGEVEPEGGEFEENTVVELNPIPSDEWLFDRWGGEDSDEVVYEDGTWKITMDSDKAVTAVFVQMDTVSTPIIEPAADEYTEPVEVNIHTPTEGATIHYTTDGTEPDSSHGEVFEDPFILEEDTTVKAMAFKDDMIDSEVATAEYQIDIPRWENIGEPGFSEGVGQYVDMTIDNGVIYVAYQDQENENKATLMTYNGSWEPLGEEGFSAGAVEDLSLHVYDGIPYVVFRDGSRDNKATVMSYEGSWEYVGEGGFTEDTVKEPAVYRADDTIYLGFADSNVDYKASVMTYFIGEDEEWKYKEGALSPGGHSMGFSEGEITDVSLSYDYNEEIVIISYVDTDDELGYMKNYYEPFMMPAQWVDYNDPTPYPVDKLAFSRCESGDSFAAFSDLDEGEGLTVLGFDDGSPFSVGNRAFSEGTVSDIDVAVADGIPFVAYKDDAYDNKPVVKKFIDEEWVSIGDAGFTVDSVEYISIVVFDTQAYIAFCDGAADDSVSVMKYTEPVY